MCVFPNSYKADHFGDVIPVHGSDSKASKSARYYCAILASQLRGPAPRGAWLKKFLIDFHKWIAKAPPGHHTRNPIASCRIVNAPNTHIIDCAFRRFRNILISTLSTVRGNIYRFYFSVTVRWHQLENMCIIPIAYDEYSAKTRYVSLVRAKIASHLLWQIVLVTPPCG